MSKAKIFFSFFFILLVATGCGIPNYFYLGTGYYTNNVTRAVDTHSVTIPNPDSGTSGPPTITINEDIQKININISLNDTYQTNKCVDCPSAVVFYWIDKDAEPVGSVVSGMSTSFSSKYKKNEPSGGVPITLYQGDQENPVIDTYNYKIATSDNTEEEKKESKEIPYNLYYVRLFDPLTGEEKQIQSPTFHAIPNASSGATSISFSIQMPTTAQNTSEYRKIYLIQNEGTAGETKYEMRRFNGNEFKTIPAKDEFPTYGDYSVLADEDTAYAEGESIYVHFAVAFCAAKGNFNNIFWSSLYSSGSVLTLPIYEAPQPPATSSP